MLLTVTPNLCIERTVQIPAFTAGKVHRVDQQDLFVNAGGKGINAARVARELGCGVLALSWAGKNQRPWFEDQLARENVACDLIETDRDTRVCVNVLHEGGKTEIVEAGAELEISDGTRMLEKFESHLPRAKLVAICGSYPPSTRAAFDTHLTLLCALGHRHNTPVLVDGKGAAFKMLLRSKFLPWAIKPNCDEAAAFLEYPVDDEASERRAVKDFLDLGIELVLLSCGARGAYLGTRGSTLFVKPPRVAEVSAVGAGDAFVGAFCAKFLETGNIETAARWGVAAGAASASQARSAFCTRDDTEALLPEVETIRVQSL